MGKALKAGQRVRVLGEKSTDLWVDPMRRLVGEVGTVVGVGGFTPREHVVVAFGDPWNRWVFRRDELRAVKPPAKRKTRKATKRARRVR